MPVMHLGVIDLPYSWGQKKAGGISAAKALHAYKQFMAGKMASPTSGNTTGDVADMLEARYRVMQVFLQIRESQINQEVEKSMQGALETILMGGPVKGGGQMLASATSQIEHLFKDALAMRAYDGKIQGVPTLAAKKGVSHRFKNPYARRPSRPSFIDTGLYQASFKAWTS
jgi:hypothetical protein